MEKSRIGPFALEGRLGERDRGNVYRGIHLEQRRQVAVKLFSAPLVESNPVAVSEYMREFDALKRLRHPNIVACYGGGLDEGVGYLCGELVRGESLEALLTRRGRLPWEMVVDYAQQICEALRYAHEAGIVHQELRPDKLLICESGALKVADFRLDRSRTPNQESPPRRTLAKAAYLAPEQIQDDAAVGSKADLYALGCILFRMLTGQLPFEAESAQAMLQQHLQAPAPRVASLVLDCPVWLDVLVSQLLEKDPLRRPHSAAAVVLALQEISKNMAAGTSVTEHALGGISSLRMQADKSEAMRAVGRKKRKKKKKQAGPFYEQIWFLVACLLLLLAGATWVLWPHSERQLFVKAQVLMESDDELQWRKARQRYLEPLLERFPDGQYAAQAQDYIDQIEMVQAESRLALNTRLGRPPKTEGERLFAEAWTFEQFGDRLTALDKYRSLINLLSEDGPDRPYVKLAEQRIAEFDQAGAAEDRSQYLKEKLAQADQMHEQGQRLQARKLWHSIVTLYSGNRELLPLVEQAQQRLEDTDTSDREPEPPDDDTETPERE